MEINVSQQQGRVPVTVFHIKGDIDAQTSGELESQAQQATIALKWGKLRVKSLAFALPDGGRTTSVSVKRAGVPLAASHVRDGQRLTVTMAADTILSAGQSLEIVITY